MLFYFWHLIAGQEKHTHPLKCAPFLLHKQKVKRTVFTCRWSSPQCPLLFHLYPTGWEKKTQTGALRGGVYDKYFPTELRHVSLRQNDSWEWCPLWGTTPPVHTGAKRTHSLATCTAHKHTPADVQLRHIPADTNQEYNQRNKQPQKAEIKLKTLASLWHHEHLLNSRLKIFPAAGFEQGKRVTVQKNKIIKKNFTLPLTLAQMKRPQITCTVDEMWVVLTCSPPRTPILCLCKHTLKIMYRMWVCVASERDSQPNCPPSCAAAVDPLLYSECVCVFICKRER